MKKLFNSWVVRVLALMFAGSVAFAQDRVPFRQEELDQMLAPVALYPDSLLSQMLMASTYPLEVVQAARWSKANPSLKGEQAVKAVERMDWDPSVKSLVAFPEVLARMDERLDWTERLGEAFLAQQKDVMATIQDLRRRADAKGNLQSNERMRVVRESENIVIEPPAREVVYVPYYSPAVVYGPWWSPAYPPVYWAAPPAYYAYPAYGPAYFWGPAIGFTAGFFFGAFDWHHHHAVVHHHGHHGGHGYHHSDHRTGFNRSDATAARRETWRHDPAHRRGVPFRTAAARERFEQDRVAAADRRGSEDGTRVARRAEDNRTAELRQRRADERRSTAGDGNRQALNDNGNRGQRAQPAQPAQPGQRNPERASGTDRPDARATQAQGPRPETRSAQPDRDTGRARPDRASPPSADRRSDRGEPRTTARLRAGSDESRAGVRAELQRRAQAPAASPAARPTVAERRAQPHLGGQVRPASQPQRHTERAPAPRVHHAPAPQPQRYAERAPAPAPRATAPAPAPRAQSQPRASGGGREFSAGRGGGGRS